ncbi:sister chromatid cohesion protein 1 [Ceratobasidium sp. UAMH 11750]|nr:sister chromatid cohesion protein 1 [Ceratobasidium sp. UAMH 11750]
MFYSEAILSRRGPLGKVWLAAHWERKLSKTQTLQTDISESVDAILGQEIVPMALRLSGQLLLGVCRIYSRKAKYLLDDCNEALLKIRLAFRPGIVDMTEDQLQVPRNAITLSGEGIDIDLLMPDMNWDLDFVTRAPGAAQNLARPGDITLASAADVVLTLDDAGYGFDLGPLDGIGSQDLDLGLDYDDLGPEPSRKDDEGDETMGVELGRDAPVPRSARESLASALLGAGGEDLDRLTERSRSKTREPSIGAEGDTGLGFMDVDVGDFGGDLNLGIGFDEPPLVPELIPEDTVQLEGEKTPLADRSRASTPLSEPPPTPKADDVLPGITPKTAARISKKAEETEKLTGKKKAAVKKPVVDSVAELAEDRPGRRGERDLSAIQTEQHFLPNSTTVMRLLEIRADPIAHFLPTKTTPNGTFFCAAPPGLPPSLAEMFMFPTTNLRRAGAGAAPPVATPGPHPRDEEGEEVRTPKRARISVPGEEPEVEFGMRRAPSERAPSEHGFGPDITFGTGDEGPSAFGEAPQFDVGDVELEVGRPPSSPAPPKSRAQSLVDDEVRSRYSTPGLGRSFDDTECAIAGFDHRVKGAESQTQTSESEVSAGSKAKGVSKNTALAIQLLQDRLQPDESEEEKVVSFAQVSNKATRRAASSFFFELLLLSTRDCIKVAQGDAFSNIEVRAKDKLWEQQVPAAGEVDPTGREATPSASSVIGAETD